MIVLSAGIRVSPLEQQKEPDLSLPAEAPATPGDIIPEWWEELSRIGGGIIPESWAICSESPV
jgi:hypothetical protein